MKQATLGVIIVTFNSETVIDKCLQSLFAAEGSERLRIVIVDNESSDNTLGMIEVAAARSLPADQIQVVNRGASDAEPLRLTVIRSGTNGGYAFGVNQGLAFLAQDQSLSGYWVLNPDVVVPPATPRRLMERACAGPFGLLSSRCLFADNPEIIQTDGGEVNRRSGVCSSLNGGKAAGTTPLPNANQLDYVSGANFVVSPAFLAEVGFMTEDYFLYYEEVDWAFRRGSQPIELVPGAEVLHIGGTSIGSGTLSKAASSFANYFNHRNRVWFLQRHFPKSVASGRLWGAAKAAQVLVKVGRKEAYAVLAGTMGWPPPKAVAARLSEGARAHAFPPAPQRGERQIRPARSAEGT
ncbi:glycosyltransferase family 2 protein [Sphingomonas sp.]|uniref:glycosyltransferase family 2 protein n=1 Tax=Sphingomonas sp. TaxID=28214 RepID=UPI002DF72B64|nr:glycosyltransferase family 2 protein [Sphingomonas sp.]